MRRLVRSPTQPIELWLEPVGTVCRLPPGRELEVSCQGSRPGKVEEERHPEGHLALYAWPGARFSVIEGGQEIYAESDVSPEFPTRPGGTIREMIQLLFGSFEERRKLFTDARS